MITNSYGLPRPLYEAIKGDPYSRGEADISVTSLSKPPRMVALEEVYADQIITDASSLARPFIGRAVHEFIAKRSDGELDDAKRLFAPFLGWNVSGQTDHYHDGRILDYKTVGVNEWRFGLRTEREEQLNCYAELLRINGYEVTALAACLIFVDWSPTRAGYEANYPPASIVEMEVPLWPSERARAFIEERVALHKRAQEGYAIAQNEDRDDDLAQNALPECTREERWGATSWAVVKDGAKRATRVFQTKEEADRDVETRGFQFEVQERIKDPVRCMHYCSVAFACSQWKGEQ